MPVVVGVHGIAQQYGGSPGLTTAWSDAVRGGLIEAGHSAVAQGLAADDVRVAFFGGLFRPPGVMAGEGPPYTAADIEAGAERDLLAAWYEAAVAADPSLGPPGGAMGGGRVAVQVMVAQLLRSATFAWLTERLLFGSFKQVTSFLRDPDVKDRVIERVAAEVGDDTRVLVGHSLGSVVAYEFLCRVRPPSVRLLVTLGSPLGTPNLVFDRLTPAPVAGRGVWPGSVVRWVNVADPADVVALRKNLAKLFPAPAGASIRDRTVDNGGRPHAVERYLTAAETGEALGAALT